MLEFFRLKENPFGEAPDPRFYFAAAAHEQALRQLDWALENDKAFTLVLGASGSGKTLLSRLLYHTLGDSAVAMLVNPLLGPKDILRAVCQEFGIQPGADADLEPLYAFLLNNAEAGRRSVLMIDEAQLLSAESLEFIRLLTNLETNKRKLLQIVLFAQPEFETALAGPALAQLAQRIYLRVRVGALSAEESDCYLRHRLEIAGGGNFVRFDAAGAAYLHQLCNGSPRLLNKAAETALLFAARQGRRGLDSSWLKTLPWRELGFRGRTKRFWPFTKGARI